MMVGSVMVAVCFLTMGWANEIVGLVVTDEDRVGFPDGFLRCLDWVGGFDVFFVQAKTAVETLAVVCIYAVDFAINAGKGLPECDGNSFYICLTEPE